MEDFFTQLMIPSLISGIIFTVIGYVMYTFPPKEINGLYGYRTSSSIKSQERWDFSQRYSSLQMIKGGAAMIVLSLLAGFIPVTDALKQIAGLVVLVLCAIYLIASTEMALKKQFPKPKA
jgi:uncharacterized membrane protein